MGQYFRPVILDDTGKIVAHFDTHEYGNGYKLMEHSYLDNQLVAAVESLLASDGPRRVVWAGDYAENEPGTDINLHLIPAGDPVRFEDAPGFGTASYLEPVKPNAKLPVQVTTASHPFIVNVDKQVYVDKRDVPAIPGWLDMHVHPLPLLTAEGNGGGGGDYRGEWPHVGTWARDHIYVTATQPDFPKLDVSRINER